MTIQQRLYIPICITLLERYSNWFRDLYKTLLPENFGKHGRDWPAGETVRDQASHSRKQDTARPHSGHWWLSHQGPVFEASQSSKVWLLSIKIVKPRRSQPQARQWRWKQSVTNALCWTASRSHDQITYAITLTDLVSLLQKVESGMGSPADIHL